MPFKVSFKHFDDISRVLTGTWGAREARGALISRAHACPNLLPFPLQTPSTQTTTLS